MIDLADLRTRPDAYKKAAKDKRITVDIDAFLALDEARRTLTKEVEDMRSQQNAASKKIPAMHGEEKAALLQEMKELSATLKAKEAALETTEKEWLHLQLLIPAPTLPKVPVGKDDTENVEIRRWGDIRNFDFAPKDHVTLGESLDIVDIARGVKIAGSRTYFLKGDGA